MVSGHAYPWDVLGDPDFPDRVRQLGIGTVTLAATYHSTRAATPLHPRRQLVEATYAALYRPVHDELWAGRRLAPLPARWLDEPDPFGSAATTLRSAGLAVSAWIVLTHNTRLGSANPDVAVVNCFGEPYPYALCPANEEVRDYAALLAGEAVRDVELDGVSLEGCGQMGITHLSHHEKTDGAWSPLASRLLSVCCCAACRRGWADAGLDGHRTVGALRAAVRAEAHGDTGGPGDPRADHGDAVPIVDGLDTVLAVRHAATDALRAQVLAAVGSAQPGLPLTLHAHPDPWNTGASPGLTPTAAADADALLVPCWPTGEATAQLVAAAAAYGRPVDAYVTVLPPADPAAVAGHARRLLDAGASRLSLYHLGLAPRWRQPLLADLAALEEKHRAR